MTWYYGKFACGHEGRVNVIGKHSEREWKIEKEFSKLCPECWGKKIEKERETETKEAERIAKKENLVEMEGSEKQIKWAFTLRQKLINNFDSLITEIENNEDEDEVIEDLDFEGLNLGGGKKEIIEKLKEIKKEIIKSYTKASNYIDIRYEIDKNKIFFLIRMATGQKEL